MAKVFASFDALPGSTPNLEGSVLFGSSRERYLSFLGTYISQSSGKDLSLAESFLLQLTSTPHKKHIKQVFEVLCGYVYQKKAKE